MEKNLSLGETLTNLKTSIKIDSSSKNTPKWQTQRHHTPAILNWPDQWASLRWSRCSKSLRRHYLQLPWPKFLLHTPPDMKLPTFSEQRSKSWVTTSRCPCMRLRTIPLPRCLGCFNALVPGQSNKRYSISYFSSSACHWTRTEPPNESSRGRVNCQQPDFGNTQFDNFYIVQVITFCKIPVCSLVHWSK